jgi:hypothetical protein
MELQWWHRVEGTAQHKMPSNRENVNGRGQENGCQHNGGRGRGSHAIVTHLSLEVKKMLSYGLSLVGFGKKRQKCREALPIRRFKAHYDMSRSSQRACKLLERKI